MTLEEIKEYLDYQLLVWNLVTKRVDVSYDLKIKIIEKDEFVGVYKVGYMGDEIEWCFVFGIAKEKDKFTMKFFLNDTEEEIYNSLIKAGFDYTPNVWLKEFKISTEKFEDVKNFLNKHVWCYDFGYFY